MGQISFKIHDDLLNQKNFRSKLKIIFETYKNSLFFTHQKKKIVILLFATENVTDGQVWEVQDF